MRKSRGKSRNNFIAIGTFILVAFIFSLLRYSEYIVTHEETNDLTSVAETVTVNDLVFEPVTVVRIVDGDTIVVEHEDGTQDKVRFIGVNCPETEKSDSAAEPYADEAMDYTTEILPVGSTIYLSMDQSETDKYDRLLRLIWIDIPSDTSEEAFRTHSMEGLLLTNGLAEVMTIDPDDTYADIFENLEAEAQKEEIGVWSENAA